jgi:predicted Ser/Thr protein kinase
MARRCLIVANQYYQDPAFDELPGASEDANSLFEVLANPKIGAFEITVVSDASSTLFRRSIELFFQQTDRDDLLWLHISCHGMKNRENRLFMIASDTEKEFLASTGVDCTFISDQVEGSRSSQVVVFLDCCYSGAYSRGLRTRSGQDLVDVAEAFCGRGRVVITASNALQFSHESTITSRNTVEPSIFTKAIVDGLRTGKADLDCDGRISVDELYEYVYQQVLDRLPSQTPTLSVSNVEGTLFLAKSARVGAKGPYGAFPPLLSERYELGKMLGYGGTSDVHRGRDIRLGREVAIKVLQANLARNQQVQHRFRKEAQNAATLKHPTIVAVYDTGEMQSPYGSLPYIVMEFVDGRTLSDIIKSEGAMDEQQAIETMADVCAALDFSHRGGIIHRDVKPANVMITKSGAVKVMDFGIARALADGGGVTQTGAVIGTAHYLSPEQARGEAVDARSDVYAAGCVLYKLLTGSPPFTGDSPVAVAYQHVREDPKRPSQENPDVSPALDAVVLRSMSKNPANRYQSAAEMRSDLVRVLAGQRPQAPMVMTDDYRTTLLAAGTGEGESGRRRPDPEDNEDGRRDRTGPLVLAGLVAVGLLTLLLLLFTNLFGGGPPQVVVPAVIGEPFEGARETLIQAGSG